MQAYALQAKDRSLIDAATELKLRAEVRVGELLAEMAEHGERQKPGDDRSGVDSSAVRPSMPTLKDLGVSKSQSSRWQRLAALPLVEQEEAIASAKAKAVGAVDRAGRAAAKPRRDGTRGPRQTLVDLCTTQVRYIVRKAMRKGSQEEVGHLFEALKEALVDLEKEHAQEHRRSENIGPLH